MVTSLKSSEGIGNSSEVRASPAQNQISAWVNPVEGKQWRGGVERGRCGQDRAQCLPTRATQKEVLTKNQRAMAMLCPKDDDKMAAGGTNGVDDGCGMVS